MARGTFDDFTSKWGFNDGEMTEERDYKARDKLCELLNAREDVREKGIRVIPFDRPGVHNGCLLIVLPNENGLTDEELIGKWKTDRIDEVGLPESATDDLWEVIAEAYAIVDEE